ncbi:MAG: hypothetical protein KZQ63_09530, partial [Candidatus Thiodiazotropha sp. (ex Lucinoma aequizonata)]|nr:hypothetical protein [Candidatus Thiodiazotropha sp. (ex Lucinoma aequizonata)]
FLHFKAFHLGFEPFDLFLLRGSFSVPPESLPIICLPLTNPAPDQFRTDTKALLVASLVA